MEKDSSWWDECMTSTAVFVGFFKNFFKGQLVYAHIIGLIW